VRVIANVRLLPDMRAPAYASIVVMCLSCASQIPSVRDYASATIGISIDQYKATLGRPQSYASRIGWKERTYDLPNGNWVYVAPEAKDCLVHWEVSRAGTIIGYSLEGRGCDV
jgi:hypothetical protein